MKRIVDMSLSREYQIVQGLRLSATQRPDDYEPSRDDQTLFVIFRGQKKALQEWSFDKLENMPMEKIRQEIARKENVKRKRTGKPLLPDFKVSRPRTPSTPSIPR